MYQSKKELQFKAAKAAVGVALTTLAGVASAAPLDLGPITAAVDVGTIVVAIVALGAIMMGPNVAKWASKKLAGFFGG